MREESQMDSEVNCQREWFKSRGSDVPLWNRQNLSIEETAAYTGIGRDTIYKLIKQDDCNFTLRVGKSWIYRYGNARLSLVKKQPLIPVLGLKDLEKWHWRKVVIFQSQMEHRF